MVQILPEAPSFGTQFARNIGAGFSHGIEKGTDFAQQMGLTQAKKKQEDLSKFTTGLDTVRKMKDLVSKGNLGRGSGFMGFFGGEVAKDRQAFAQLGTSLIPIVAAGVPIRNQREFDQYKKIITDPSATTGEMMGALDALEGLFENKVSGKKSSKKSKFDASNPEHKAKAEQLFKSYGDKEKVREILQREYEGL